MSAGHSHSSGHHVHDHDGGDRRSDLVPAGPRRIVHGLLVLAAVATVFGLVVLWPDSEKVEQAGRDVQFAAPGVTFPRAIVEQNFPVCRQLVEGGGPAQTPDGERCNRLKVQIAEGDDDGAVTTVDVPGHVADSGLETGDVVRMMRVPPRGGQEAFFTYFGTERPQPIWILTVLFVLVVALVARQRGLFALIGLALAGVVFATFLLPAVLAGTSALLVGLVASSAIMFVVLYTTHGFSVRSSVALLGTLAGIALTALIGWLSVTSTHLTGVADEGANVLLGISGGMDFQGLLTCAIMIAGLGVLNDVTITQASAVWELRAASRSMGRAELFASGMRIGRDHIASTIYTIAFAYAGTALTTLLVLSLYDLPLLDLLSTEQIGQEVVRTLATSIGLVLAVPLTTGIAALLVEAPRPEPDDQPAGLAVDVPV